MDTDPSKRPAKEVEATCTAFFIGDSDSDSESCAAVSMSYGESYAESCQRPPRRPSLEFSFDALSTAASSLGGHNHEDVSDPAVKPLDLSHFHWLGMRDQLTLLSDEMVSFRSDLNVLSKALNNERKERLAGQFALVLDKECSKRLAYVEKISEQGHCFSAAGLEATKSCLASVEELSDALFKETRERIELETSVESMQQALQAMQAEFEQGATHLANLDLDCTTGSDKELSLSISEEEQEQLICHIKEFPRLAHRVENLSEAVEKERQDRVLDCEDVFKVLSQTLKKEGTVRERAVRDMRHQLDELQVQLETLSTMPVPSTRNSRRVEPRKADD